MAIKAKAVKKTSAPKKTVKAKLEAEAAPDKAIRWKAPDYYANEKGPLWSLMIGLVAVLLSLLLIYTGNYVPVVIVILAVIVAFQISHEKPQTVEFAIDESGVIARNQYYPFDELESFWISRQGEKKYILYLETASIWRGPLTIPLGQKSITEVKSYLLGHLPEEFNYGEMFSDKLIRIFKL
jgi:hypothetical protein